MVLGEEREALWREVLVAKYGEEEEGGWVPSRVPRYRVSMGDYFKFGDMSFFKWERV